MVPGLLLGKQSKVCISGARPPKAEYRRDGWQPAFQTVGKGHANNNQRVTSNPAKNPRYGKAKCPLGRWSHKPRGVFCRNLRGSGNQVKILIAGEGSRVCVPGTEPVACVHYLDGRVVHFPLGENNPKMKRNFRSRLLWRFKEVQNNLVGTPARGVLKNNPLTYVDIPSSQTSGDWGSMRYFYSLMCSKQSTLVGYLACSVLAMFLKNGPACHQLEQTTSLFFAFC